jgi:hypothetical protein
VVEPGAARAETCAQQQPHGSRTDAKALEQAVRTLRTLSRPLPGDDAYREFLNEAHARGDLTGRERHRQRLLHNVLRRRLASRQGEG